MNRKKKPEIITFKVDESLLEAMEHIPNRSEFIRHAVQAALEHSCPLCNGTGVLSPEQHDHWKSFSASHQLRRCEECRDMHLVCQREEG